MCKIKIGMACWNEWRGLNLNWCRSPVDRLLEALLVEGVNQQASLF